VLLSGIVGIVGGFGSGLFGIGGGSIRIPLLNLAGFSLISAYGMNLLALPLTCLAGAASQRENIDYRIGSYMILGGSIGTVLGTLFAFHMASSALLLATIFLLASLVAVVLLNINNFTHQPSTTGNPSPLKLVSGTLTFNTITGMRGGSEGSLFVPLLRALNVEMHKAIATALFSAVFTSIVGVALYWNQGHIPLLEGLALLIGSVIGARIGSMLSVKSKSRSLRLGLTTVIIVLAVLTLLKAACF